MHAKLGKTTWAAGGALALALGAGLVLGTAPAHAASTTYDLFTGHYGPVWPDYNWSIGQTRDEADRRCVNTYGFRARGAEPVRQFSKGDDDPFEYEWYVTWKCTSN